MSRDTKIELEIDSKTLSMRIPPGKPGFQSCFLFSAHKSGSTLLNRMVSELCQLAHVPNIDFPSAYFRAGIGIDAPGNAARVGQHLLPQGYVYSGARTFWCKDVGFDFSGVKKLFLVRDPRDAIVSWYFSDKLSHGIPKGNKSMRSLREKLQASKGINEDTEYLASRARALNSLALKYREILSGRDSVVYRYEDVIFRKRLWLEDIAKFLDLDVSYDEIISVADKHDITPESEDSNRFIRQVTPGNYLKHLNPETVCFIESILSDHLEMFRYNSVDRFEI